MNRIQNILLGGGDFIDNLRDFFSAKEHISNENIESIAIPD